MARSPQEPDPQQRPSDSADLPPAQAPGTPAAPIDAPTEAPVDYVDGVPTFDFVRDRIEGRYATAMGTTELAEESTAGRSLAQQQEDRDAAARERLAEIRRSLREE